MPTAKFPTLTYAPCTHRIPTAHTSHAHANTHSIYAFVPLEHWGALAARVAASGFSHPSGRLHVGGVKVFADGSLGSMTALMHDEYRCALCVCHSVGVFNCIGVCVGGGFSCNCKVFAEGYLAVLLFEQVRPLV